MDNLSSFDAEKFYLGKLCASGHDYDGTGCSLRRRSDWKCLECARIKCKERNARNAARKKECNKSYYQQNRDNILAQKKDYQKRNCEEISKRRKNRHADLSPEQKENWRLKVRENWAKNCEARRKQKRERYWENRSSILLELKRRRIEHRDTINQKDREKYQRNRDVLLARAKTYRQSEKGRLVDRRNKHKRRSLKRKNHHAAYSNQDLQHVYDRFDGCAYCRSRKDLTLDHFIPLSKSGPDCLLNLVVACHRCNSSKKQSDPWEWFQRQPFFSQKRWQKILELLGRKDYRQLPLL